MLSAESLVQELEEALAELPVIDAHTHLTGGRLGARGLHDILLYHMVISDLYAAGCPDGARLTEYPGWPTDEEAKTRIERALPYLELARNTSNAWGLRMILADLYDWHEPVTADTWQRLDAIVRERADDRAWWYGILDRLNIRRTCTELARRRDGSDDERLQYALEWAMPTRAQWGRWDSPLYELERTWGEQPGSPAPIGGDRPPAARTIRTLDDAQAALDHYVSVIPDHVVSTATHISTDIDYSLPGDDEMARALERRDSAGREEQNVYASYLNEGILTRLEQRTPPIVFQFSFGAEPLPYETGSRLSQATIGHVGDMAARHPGLGFQCFVASRHGDQALCTLARELPNFSLAGYWWHNFYPDAIRQVMSERLDMVPVNKQIGFFSDAYAIEWTYGKMRIVRRQLAHVLASKVVLGQYDVDSAISIARSILFESPQTLNRLVPRTAG